MNFRILSLCLLSLLPAVSHAQTRTSGEKDFAWNFSQVRTTAAELNASRLSDEKELQPGIGLWRRFASALLIDLANGWSSDGYDAIGICGAFGRLVPKSAKIETIAFGRSASSITLRLAVDQTTEAQSPPRWARVNFQATFPEDLPFGPYKISVLLQDKRGIVLDQLQCNFVKAPKTNEFDGWKNEDLLAEYIRRGEALRGMTVEPIDADIGRVAASRPYGHPKRRVWVAAHDEIIRRGPPMVAGLMKQLAVEAVRNPGKDEWPDVGFGMAFDVMEMLTRIDDPRPVDLLIEIAGGLHGRANVAVRTKAIESLQRLTRPSFLSDRNHIGESYSVLAPNAVIHNDYGWPKEHLGAQAEQYAA